MEIMRESMTALAIRESFVEEVNFFSDMVECSKGTKGNPMKSKTPIQLVILFTPGACPRGSYSYHLLKYSSRDSILCSYEHTCTSLFFLTQMSSCPGYFFAPCFVLLTMYLENQSSLVSTDCLVLTASGHSIL